MTQARFRPDNTTEGFDEQDLDELNEAWRLITVAAPFDDGDDDAIKSMLDNWADRLLSEYGAGKRGDALVEWFSEPT